MDGCMDICYYVYWEWQPISLKCGIDVHTLEENIDYQDFSIGLTKSRATAS